MIYIKKEKTNVLVIYHKIVKNTKKKGKTIDKRKRPTQYQKSDFQAAVTVSFCIFIYPPVKIRRFASYV